MSFVSVSVAAQEADGSVTGEKKAIEKDTQKRTPPLFTSAGACFSACT